MKNQKRGQGGYDSKAENTGNQMAQAGIQLISVTTMEVGHCFKKPMDS